MHAEAVPPNPGRRPAAVVVWTLCALCALAALPARGQDGRHFRLAAVPEIVESGLLAHLLPRFMLKTGRRGEIVAGDGAPDVVISDAPGPSATAVMQRGGTVYRLRLTTGNDAARRFADWLASDIGQDTLAAYAPPDGPPFAPPPMDQAEPEMVIVGDPAHGRRVADTHCARCHRIHPEGRGIGIGSTPSFAGLRNLPDWADRFAAFFALNPHPAFLRIEGLSPAFDISRPPPIMPVTITLEDAMAVRAYVATLPPANLGASVSPQ